MDRLTRKRLFNLCDPEEPLAPDDRRNVDVDAMPGAARGQRWVDVLAGPMELSGRPSFTLVTAQRGAGLTTELRRLAARLGSKGGGGANLLVVYVDGEGVLDVHGTLDVPDVLLAVMERLTSAVAAAEGTPEDPGTANRLWRWLADPDVSNQGIQTLSDLRTNPAARERFRARAGAELSRFVKEVRNEAVVLNGRARRLGYEGIAVLFDSLTHVQGDSSTWDAVLASAERLFGAGASYLELPIHLLYTVPVPLVLRLATPIHFLPQIALPWASAAEEIVQRRVPRAGGLLDAVLGSGRVKRLLAWSAGNPGAIVRLLRECVAAGPVDDRRLSQILSLDADGVRRTTPDSAYRWLARVHVERTLSFAASARDEAERLLAGGAVVRYQGDEVRYETHPTFLTVPRVATRIERLSRLRGTIDRPDGRR